MRNGGWAVQAGASSTEEVSFGLPWMAEPPPEPGRAAAAGSSGQQCAPAPREMTRGRRGRPRKKTEGKWGSLSQACSAACPSQREALIGAKGESGPLDLSPTVDGEKRHIRHTRYGEAHISGVRQWGRRAASRRVSRRRRRRLSSCAKLPLEEGARCPCSPTTAGGLFGRALDAALSSGSIWEAPISASDPRSH